MKHEPIVDEKLEQLLTAYTKDYFYAKANCKFEDGIDSAKARTLKFTYDFNDCWHFGIKVEGKAINGVCLEWCDPGLKALIALFYALERGYEEIFLEEYDYYDNYARYTINTNKDSNYAILFIEDHAGLDKITEIVINKEKSIKNFKRMLKYHFSDDNQFNNRAEDLKFYLPKYENWNEEDVAAAEEMVEEWNFIRGLTWIFDSPFPEQTMRDFLDDERYENYVSWKDSRKKWH